MPREQVLSAASFSGASADLQMAGDVPFHAPSGAVEHHLLDDPPAPAQAEGGTDLPALMPHLADALRSALAMARPGPHLVAAWLAPTLDGLRRPPRGIKLAA